MPSPSDLALCSTLAQQAYHRLLKINKGPNIRTSTIMSNLGTGLGVDQMEVKGVVRELYRAGFLTYTPDRQELPAGSIITLVLPEKTVSLPEQTWSRLLDGSALTEEAKEALRPFYSRVMDLSCADMASLVGCLSTLQSGVDQVDDAGFNVSARTLMGGSKVLACLAPKMLQALGLPLRLHTSSPRYVVCAGPAQPMATLLIENPRAFENAIRSGLADTVALVCTYGFGLSYLGQEWLHAPGTSDHDRPIVMTRVGSPPSLDRLFALPQVYLWADLDRAGFGIYLSLMRAIPHLKLSAIYRAMDRMLDDPAASHPYDKIFEKDGQTITNNHPHTDPLVIELWHRCAFRAVDQEAVLEADILALGATAL